MHFFYLLLSLALALSLAFLLSVGLDILLRGPRINLDRTRFGPRHQVGEAHEAVARKSRKTQESVARRCRSSVPVVTCRPTYTHTNPKKFARVRARREPARTGRFGPRHLARTRLGRGD